MHMKLFWKYVFPPLLGLLIYAVVRVINDSISGFRFWKRDWSINVIEVISAMLMGYIMHYALQQLFRKFDRNIQHSISYKTVLRELLWVFVIIELCVNAVFTPMAALTDDGLSWGDVAVINIIPLMFSLIYYGITRTNKILQVYVNNKLLLEKISNDQLETELKFLRAQYHPHFLFNALNTIYFQMDESVEAAKRTVEKFSELLRYQLYDQQQIVPLSTEIAYLQSFIELQKIRTSEKLQLRTAFDATLNDEQIYPLLLLPLVENAFKYVGGAYDLTISLTRQNEELVFFVENAVPPEINFVKTNGIGLENLKRRLALLYPGNHSLRTGRRNNSFVAELKLKLN